MLFGADTAGRRHRLNPGGDRRASHALWRIVITRMGSHPPTRAYATRRTKDGLSKKEIIRCLKRYVAREAYPHPAPAIRLTPKTSWAAWPHNRLPRICWPANDPPATLRVAAAAGIVPRASGGDALGGTYGLALRDLRACPAVAAPLMLQKGSQTVAEAGNASGR
jgi:hypothetical protein